MDDVVGVDLLGRKVERSWVELIRVSWDKELNGNVDMKKYRFLGLFSLDLYHLVHMVYTSKIGVFKY